MAAIFSKFLSQGIGIDLGTANTLIYQTGKGITLNEPSVVAVRAGTGEVLAIGEQAKQMLGRTPGEIMAIRPMKDGVIADFEITQIMLRHFIRKVLTGKAVLFSPKVVICVPSGITEVEKRAVEEAARQAGAKEAYLIDEPVAAAMGAEMDISEPRGRMIVDIGGGTTEVAVISLNGIVVQNSMKVGGDFLDNAIVDYVRQKYNVFVGEATAEYVKIQIGNVLGSDEQITVRGRSLVSGLPVGLSLTGEEVRDAIQESVGRMVTAVKQTLESTPPELAADIYADGIVMTGGTSMLKGLDALIARETGVPVRVAEEPLIAVARGAGRAVEGLERDRHALFAEKVQA